ncbi:hypothetical protein M3Y96_00629800 [Aphelenchoides besseyi]|nr:hypothetical protein M3Y96_00629800 [Aphelenchoides besseyi]
MFSAFVSLLIVVLVVEGDACRCSSISQQFAYDTADFVVRSKVVNKKLSPGGTSIVYELENKRTFKPKDEILKNQVFTSPMESGCGVTNLKVGREYLLAGTISGFKQRITRCLAIPHADADTTEVLEWKYVDEKLIEELKSEVFA